jgi:hypothetical protein
MGNTTLDESPSPEVMYRYIIKPNPTIPSSYSGAAARLISLSSVLEVVAAIWDERVCASRKERGGGGGGGVPVQNTARLVYHKVACASFHHRGLDRPTICQFGAIRLASRVRWRPGRRAAIERERARRIRSNTEKGGCGFASVGDLPGLPDMPRWCTARYSTWVVGTAS